MPSFSAEGEKKLATCHPLLQQLFRRVVGKYDCTIVTGHRGQADQDLAVAEGRSQTPWPIGNHNNAPSLAVDANPYPHPMMDAGGNLTKEGWQEFCMFAGYVLGLAEGMGIRLRWGGDWNGNWKVTDEKFRDLYHFELRMPQ